MQPSLDAIERNFRRARVYKTTRATKKELIVTLCVASFVTPFFFVTFFTLPLMGQIVVGFAAMVTAFYLFFRRSILIFLAGLAGSGLFSILTFATIQSIKYRIEIPLFIFLALGIPVAIMYSIFLGMCIAAQFDKAS